MKTKQSEPSTVSIREWRQHMGHYTALLRRGRRLTLTHHGRPLATVVPKAIESEQPTPLERKLIELEQRGIIRRGIGKPLGLHPRVKLRGKPISQTVIEDRQHGW